MRGDEFLDKLELVDPAYVEAADARPNKRKSTWVRWGAAACIGLVLAGVLAVGQRSAPRPSGPVDFGPAGLGPARPEPGGPEPAGPEDGDFEPLTLPELNYGGMGFEGYLYHDISELDNRNPWSEDMGLTALPVYRNGSYDPTGAGIAIGLSEAEMWERLKRTASALGLEVLSTEVMNDESAIIGLEAPHTGPTRICAHTTGGGEIEVYADGRIDYWLSGESLALPDEYGFTWHDTTDEEAERVLAYLAETYRELLGFAEPEAASYGDYNIYGSFHRDYYVYDASGDDVKDILNYHFRPVEFVPNEEGGSLWLIRIRDHLLCAEKMGDYPIVTAAEAAERLLAGHYATSVPCAFPGEEYIGKVELTYRTGRLDELFLPYYRFYVLLPEEAGGSATAAQNGLKTYGAYYVPAIADEYVTNMPTYDGHFN